jgi:hypothetical protein
MHFAYARPSSACCCVIATARSSCRPWSVRRKKTVQRDPEGRLLSEEEEELTDALPTRDGLTVDEITRAHQRRMSRGYQAYDNWIERQWRNP